MEELQARLAQCTQLTNGHVGRWQDNGTCMGTIVAHSLVTAGADCVCSPAAGAGHEMEIVCLNFNPQSTILATGSMDHTAKVC